MPFVLVPSVTLLKGLCMESVGLFTKGTYKMFTVYVPLPVHFTNRFSSYSGFRDQ